MIDNFYKYYSDDNIFNKAKMLEDKIRESTIRMIDIEEYLNLRDTYKRTYIDMYDELTEYFKIKRISMQRLQNMLWYIVSDILKEMYPQDTLDISTNGINEKVFRKMINVCVLEAAFSYSQDVLNQSSKFGWYSSQFLYGFNMYDSVCVCKLFYEKYAASDKKTMDALLIFESLYMEKRAIHLNKIADKLKWEIGYTRNMIDYISDNVSDSKFVYEVKDGGLSLTTIGRMAYASISNMYREVVTVTEYAALEKRMVEIIDKIEKKYDSFNNESWESVHKYKYNSCSYYLDINDNLRDNIENIYEMSKTAKLNISIFQIKGICIKRIGDKLRISYSNTYVLNFNNGKLSIFSSSSENCFELLLYKKYEHEKCRLLFRYICNSGKSFPARLYSLIDYHLRPILDVLSEEYVLFKDLLCEHEMIHTPISVEDILNIDAKSKREFFCKKYKIPFKIPKSINKMYFGEAYWKIKTCYRIIDNERQKIWNMSYPLEVPEKLKWHSIYNVMCWFYLCRLSMFTDVMTLEDGVYLIYDYVYMYAKIHKFFNLKISSLARITEEYNIMVDSLPRRKGR